MDNETRNFFAIAIAGVLTGVVVAFAIVWMTYTFHDWDCTKHGGVVDDKIPAMLAPQLTHKVCRDGYVP